MLGFITFDVRNAVEQVPELVDSVHQTIFGKRIDLEVRRRLADESDRV
jgi:hypothetical protein